MQFYVYKKAAYSVTPFNYHSFALVEKFKKSAKISNFDEVLTLQVPFKIVETFT